MGTHPQSGISFPCVSGYMQQSKHLSVFLSINGIVFLLKPHFVILSCTPCTISVPPWRTALFQGATQTLPPEARQSEPTKQRILSSSKEKITDPLTVLACNVMSVSSKHVNFARGSMVWRSERCNASRCLESVFNTDCPVVDRHKGVNHCLLAVLLVA